MKRFSITFFVSIFISSVGYAPSAQREQGTTNIIGRVSSALQLSVQKGWQPLADQSTAELNVAATAAGVDSFEINLGGRGQTATSRILLPLEMRTNQAYELKFTLLSVEGPAPVLLGSIGSVRSGGALVVSRATIISRDEHSIDLMHCVSPVTVLRGTRISRGGNSTTPENALLADLNLAILPGGSTQDRWRIVLRVSLHSSF